MRIISDRIWKQAPYWVENYPKAMSLNDSRRCSDTAILGEQKQFFPLVSNKTYFYRRGPKLEQKNKGKNNC